MNHEYTKRAYKARNAYHDNVNNGKELFGRREMDKPKKVKSYKRNADAQSLCDNSCNQGYNIAIEDRDNWLKEVTSIENIERVIKETHAESYEKDGMSATNEEIATKIHNLFK